FFLGGCNTLRTNSAVLGSVHMKRYALVYISVWLISLSLFNLPASAQLTRVNVGYSAVSADQLPPWVAKESGIFTKNALDVQLIFFTGGTTAILALVSKDVPITQVSGPGLVNSALAGSDAVFVAAGVACRNSVLRCKPAPKHLDQTTGC